MGRASALAFAREGASVVGCDLSVEAAEATVELMHNAGGAMVSMQPCHLTDPADCKALIELALSTFGRVDVLFNLAGLEYFNWLEDIPDEEWDRARRNEVDLVFSLTRAAWPHLKGHWWCGREPGLGKRDAQRQGRAIALSHDKHGRNHRHDATAGNGRPRTRIRVNSISPGWQRAGLPRSCAASNSVAPGSCSPSRQRISTESVPRICPQIERSSSCRSRGSVLQVFCSHPLSRRPSIPSLPMEVLYQLSCLLASRPGQHPAQVDDHLRVDVFRMRPTKRDVRAAASGFRDGGCRAPRSP
jgi:NAD(P)-dependent dehydrogenase (short-subunit alcohol dehydrogenase family)